jgi:hypothetical protein
MNLNEKLEDYRSRARTSGRLCGLYLAGAAMAGGGIGTYNTLAVHPSRINEIIVIAIGSMNVGMGAYEGLRSINAGREAAALSGSMIAREVELEFIPEDFISREEGSNKPDQS